jgi:ABC-type uncharacterized transport system ATPase subunit
VKEIVLSLKDVTVYRDTYAAVEDVSFCLEAGTDTSIVGPNGGGKTTLVEAILGILPRRTQTRTRLGNSPDFYLGDQVKSSFLGNLLALKALSPNLSVPRSLICRKTSYSIAAFL